METFSFAFNKHVVWFKSTRVRWLTLAFRNQIAIATGSWARCIRHSEGGGPCQLLLGSRQHPPGIRLWWGLNAVGKLQAAVFIS